MRARICGLAARQWRHRRRRTAFVVLLAGLLLLFPLGSSPDATRAYGTIDGWPPFHVSLGNLAVPPGTWLPEQRPSTPAALRGPRAGESSGWTRGGLGPLPLGLAACAAAVADQNTGCPGVGLRWSRPLRGPPSGVNLA